MPIAYCIGEHERRGYAAIHLSAIPPLGNPLGKTPAPHRRVVVVALLLLVVVVAVGCVVVVVWTSSATPASFR